MNNYTIICPCLSELAVCKRKKKKKKKKNVIKSHVKRFVLSDWLQNVTDVALDITHPWSREN